jgi:voltage-gated potassium channel
MSVEVGTLVTSCVMRENLTSNDRRSTRLSREQGGAVSPRLTLSSATLVVMNDSAQRPDANPADYLDPSDPGSRLTAYQARTQTILDLLALVTLWFVVVPFWYYGQDVRGIWWALRIALSVVYGIDLVICGVLAGQPARYARANPLALAAVIFPPMRAIFSFRLVRAMFRRGHLPRFLLTAAVLVLDGAIIVYLYERHAPHSNIHTLGESLWFSVVTVTTVGYGDYTPVTVYGRITAVLIMLVGLLTLAVVTAQVASNFVTQGPGRTRRSSQPQAAPPEVTLAELDRRLARIEELLTVSAPSSPRTAKAPGVWGESRNPPTDP